jgi:hypothetical protein
MAIPVTYYWAVINKETDEVIALSNTEIEAERCLRAVIRTDRVFNRKRFYKITKISPAK